MLFAAPCYYYKLLYNTKGTSLFSVYSKKTRAPKTLVHFKKFPLFLLQLASLFFLLLLSVSVQYFFMDYGSLRIIILLLLLLSRFLWPFCASLFLSQSILPLHYQPPHKLFKLFKPLLELVKVQRGAEGKKAIIDCCMQMHLEDVI